MMIAPTVPASIAAASLKAALPTAATAGPAAPPQARDGTPGNAPAAGPATGGGSKLSPENALLAQEEGADGLTPAEERQVEALKRRDAEVRRHEQAHAAAGGAYAGAPQYEYTTGPDGNRYAIGGHVSIDTGAVAGDPEATIAKLRTVKRAALAPGAPSAQDRRVAAQAEAAIAEARLELRQERAEEAKQEKAARQEPDGPGALLDLQV